ncbi:MAG: tetratricopeptide repeat protein [Clostridiales bacterium]|nr:tetratricopeptide repeat protein [Clostridiales bacterium]
MKTKTWRFFLMSSLLLLTCFYQAAAQAGRGKARLGGLVLDDAGKPIASAKVVVLYVSGEKTQWEAFTDKDGEWGLIGIGSGNALITASAEGYIPAQTNVSISQIERNPKVVLKLKRLEPAKDSAVRDEASLAFIEKATQLFNEKNYDQALAVLEQFLAQNPETYQVQILIGDCYREKGDIDKAIETYNEAIGKAKGDERMGKEMIAKSLAAVGDCYLRKGDLVQAQDFFKQSLNTYPDNETLAYNVGEIFFSNQKLDEAIHYFTIATQIKPNWAPPRYKLGLVNLNKADYEKAKEHFKKFLELESDTDLAAQAKNILEYLEKIKK